MKKKATIIILTAILIGSFYGEIYSQENYNFHPRRDNVIAANGLNMRAKPNTTSTKLVNIPYGEKVHILHKDHYGLDTVYTIKTELGDHPVYGYWQKVEYKEYVGYVHNAFLSVSYNYRESLVPGTNEDYLLLQPGYNCDEQFYNTNEYFWYGYYQEAVGLNEKAKKPYRKLIDVEFIKVSADMSPNGTIVKENNNLRFIIGTKKPFPENEMDNILNRKLYHRIHRDSITLDSSVVAQGKISMIKNSEPSNYFNQEFFYLNTDLTSQLINTTTKTYRVKLNEYYIEADLDGDGKLDYIFGHGEDDLRLGLYLSSERNEEEVVKLVSLLRRGYCC